MYRLRNTFITSQSYQNGSTAPVADLRNGNQMGFMPIYSQMVSTAPFVRQNLIPVLMKAPEGFNDLPDKDELIGALKALMEERMLSIDGVVDNLSVDTATVPFGPTEVLEVPTAVSRDTNNPSYMWQEVEGRAISNFWYNYILMLIEDPDIRAPGAITTSLGSLRTDRLMDYYAFSMLFIEPNINLNRVVNAVLIGNMFPKTPGPREMGFDKTAAQQTVQVNVQFTGLTQRGYGVKQLAQRILDEINFVGANPQTREAFMDGTDADVRAITDVGYRERIAEAVATGVQPA